jgi:predicted negative regulator of RcsB-dependent stress response
MATIILAVSAVVIVLGWLAYRRWTRNQGEKTDVGSLAATL